MENKKKDELQNRREFFKKAAKGALPILGAIVLASSPILANAADSEPNGCTRYGCGVCTNSCKGDCKGGCRYTCSGGCKHYACKGVAKN